MKVLDLRCSNLHHFEGWFASADDFVSQKERSLVACPMCGDTSVERLPSAARLNLSSPSPAAESAAPVASVPDTQALLMRAVRQVMEQTEDVGERFPEEARRIHYGETPERGIRGRATPSEREALRDEGIEVFALPVPAALKGPVQ